ncbi:nitrogen assimilation transcription factor nit-4 [Aspergillus udagawae]|uniref:Nitrogen assimilation transcription factor nit-4 n=1 Tax=Aspergillus udagawae TaxID=91492 RepID=A0A8H3SCN3_9EURO|nr:nitrogen assimilation transcription factor nit-4 [Aspergillus udagawae]
MDHPSVPTATALLLCGASLVCLGKPRTGRILCDVATRMVAGTAPLLADVDAEVRKHLYLGTYCIDVFMSLYLGHKPTIDGLDQIFADSVLDTYEELESWTPYTDPTTAGQQVPDHYESHPTYAISTFRALVDLLKVCHSIILTLYGDQKELTFASTQQAVNDFDSQLGRWYETLPSFIRDSAVSQTIPPPHLVDLLLLFHALKIIIRRPLLEQTHLSQQLGILRKLSIKGECRHESTVITDLIGTYKSAFSLRRASVITSFATYLGLATLLEECRLSAVSVSSHAELLWTAFHRMADGPNPSLQKVIAQISSQETNLRGLSAVEGNQTASTGAIATSSTSTNHRGEASLTGGDDAASSDRHSTALDVAGISPVVQGSLIPTSDGGSYQEPTSTAIHNPSIYVSRLLDLFSPVGATSFSQRWVHDATELSRNHPLLETALGAVSMLLIGKLDGDVDTEQSGELAYITLFRKKSESSASYHWIAALTLFERRGPFRHTSGMEHVLYSELRPLCVTWALTVRASTFLSKSEWKVIPWMGGGQKNVLHHLLDVLVDIPSFLEQVDTMNSMDGHQAAQKETQRELLTVWALSLRDALHQWKRTYVDTYQDGEPYEVPQASGFPLFQHWSDEGDALSTPTAWMFPDPLLATSICMYNAAHLILMGAGNLSSSEEPERYCYAWDICRSVQYYVQHVPWSFLLQIEFPLRVAYESLPEASVERTFIREVCSLICKNSKLEIFSSVTEGQHSESVVPCRGLQGTPEE